MGTHPRAAPRANKPTAHNIRAMPPRANPISAGLAGGVTSLAMLSLRLTPVQISNSGLRPPALRFVLSKKRGGEFIEKREIASLEIHETDLELKVTLRTRLGAVRVFGCSKDQWDRLLSVAPPPRDSYTNDPLRT